MTKFGTPIGGGPKGAIVVVGFSRFGAPPSSNWAPPSPFSGSGCVPPPVAVGALTAPPLLPPPLSSPSVSPWATPPRISGSTSSSSDSPRLKSLCFFFVVGVSVGPTISSPSVDPEVVVEGEVVVPVARVGGEVETSGPSVLSVGEEQSGSSMSISPSPSLSMPSAHCGTVGVVVIDGVVVVEGGVVVVDGGASVEEPTS